MPDAERATIYDVAAAVGVSISTVSLAMNNPARVRPETLRQVLEAAERLGFQPRAEAVSRARRSHDRVGVLAPFTSYPSFARRLNGVLRAYAKLSTEVVVHDHASVAGSESPLLASLPLSERLDGLIIMGVPLTAEIAERLHRQRFNVVLIDVADEAAEEFSTVRVDDAGGGAMVARFLLGRGHRRFAFIGEEQASRQYRSPSEQRFEGFAGALRAAGIPAAGIVKRVVPHRMDEARQVALELLAGPDAPTAYFTHDDVLAGGVLSAAHRSGRAVPEEVAVIGFDDLDLAEQLGLTTVRLPFEESGQVAAEILAERRQDPARSARQVTLRLTLTQRETA
ncbi:LacI family DNA-binding transcriptional regulator [Dactylosporangium sp. NPDC051541]|uniref:LacI family DNA-binding transcriptional regulator n=1 Tax=Dactylosporangium sp. NPDC051541 TaxID=3363977 RepID=UPI0037A8B4D1